MFPAVFLRLLWDDFCLLSTTVSVQQPPFLFRLYFYPASQIQLILRPFFPCLSPSRFSAACLPSWPPPSVFLHISGLAPFLSAALCSALLPLHPFTFSLSFLWIPAETRPDHIASQYLPKATQLHVCGSNKCGLFAQNYYYHVRAVMYLGYLGTAN